MNYIPYVISDKKQILPDTFIYKVKPKTGILLHFLSGQYVFLKNPDSMNPEEPHPFSIASSPSSKDYVEFCIKIYGDWTREFSQKEIGSTIEVSEAQGNFVWEKGIKHAAFLLGGIGISPIISIVRSLNKSRDIVHLTMLYGNRTPDTIAYENELETLAKTLPLKIIHIFSDINNEHKTKGYHGFITQDILQKEINFSENPTFFVVGPPIFVEKMLGILPGLGVQKENIKIEDLSTFPKL